MRFQRIIEQTYFTPWLITEQGWQSIHSLVESRVLNQRSERPAEDIFGDKLPQMAIEGSIATIPIYGVIGRKLGMIEKSCGAIDTLDISDELGSAMMNPRVKHIILDVDSPGGTVSGVPELAQQIADASKTKNVVAFANDMMASAAYWISAGASRIYAAPSSTVGSIGVFMPHIDQTERFKQAGIRVDLIKAGKFKGAGYPGTSLTDEQRAMLQDDVNATHEQFKAFVKTHRTKAQDSAMEGQVLNGNKAAEAGLVTNIIGSIEELKASLVDNQARAL